MAMVRREFEDVTRSQRGVSLRAAYQRGRASARVRVRWRVCAQTSDASYAQRWASRCEATRWAGCARWLWKCTPNLPRKYAASTPGPRRTVGVLHAVCGRCVVATYSTTGICVE